MQGPNSAGTVTSFMHFPIAFDKSAPQLLQVVISFNFSCCWQYPAFEAKKKAEIAVNKIVLDMDYSFLIDLFIIGNFSLYKEDTIIEKT
jgi:hypothetical protein